MKQLLGLPVLASQHGQQVDNLIIYVHWLMIVLFVGWLTYFAYALFRFHKSRNPKADYIGVKNHASSYIEVAVAAVEGVLLIGVAVPLWAKAVDIPKGVPATEVQIVGQQFNWHARYPGKDGKFGKQDMHFINSTNTFGIDPSDASGKDDVQLSLGEMHVVVDKPVVAYVSSRDVIHSFKVIAMRVTQDAIPGMRIPVWFRPTTVGRYQINCAQLCGNAHSAMSAGMMVVETQAEFDKWLAAQPTVGGAAAQSFE